MLTDRIPRFLALGAIVSCGLVLTVSSPHASVPTAPPVFTNPLVFTNDYFPFAVGGIKSYRGKDDGEQIAVVDVYDADTRTFLVAGVPVATRLMREVEFEDGALVEISSNYFAQADDGTVYYFGEVVDDYEDGVVVDHSGSWLVGGPTLPTDPQDAGNAPAPTVFMPANPEVGDQFKPEDLFPLVDETGTVLATDAKVKVEGGKFTAVLKIKETSLLDSGSEKKWYARGVGVVKAEGKHEKLELIGSTFSEP